MSLRSPGSLRNAPVNLIPSTFPSSPLPIRMPGLSSKVYPITSFAIGVYPLPSNGVEIGQ